VGAGLCYALRDWDRRELALALLFIVLNWLGDSLDGTLAARAPSTSGPRYGFYVDHVVDIFGSAALLGGMAVSGVVHGWVAAAMLVAFLLLARRELSANPHAGTVRDFARMVWADGAAILPDRGEPAAWLLHSSWIHRARARWLLFDVGGVAGAVGMLAMAAVVTARHTAQLHREEAIAVSGFVRWIRFNAVGALGMAVQLAVLFVLNRATSPLSCGDGGSS